MMGFNAFEHARSLLLRADRVLNIAVWWIQGFRCTSTARSRRLPQCNTTNEKCSRPWLKSALLIKNPTRAEFSETGKVGRNSEIQSEVSVPERCWQAAFVDVFTKRALTLAGLHKLDIRYFAADSPTFGLESAPMKPVTPFTRETTLTIIHFGKTPLNVLLESLSPVGHQSNA